MNAESCRRCGSPFDSADTRFDGRRRYEESGFCRGCVDRCHEATEFDHACPVCTLVVTAEALGLESCDEEAAEGMATAGPFDDDIKDYDHG